MDEGFVLHARLARARTVGLGFGETMTVLRAMAQIVLLGASVASAAAGVVFQGFLSSDAGIVFVLSTDDEKKTRWVKTGQQFEGYTVMAFDPKTNLLTVEKEGRTEQLPLTEAKIGVTRPDVPAKGSIVITVENEVFSLNPASPLETLQPRLAALAKKSPQSKVLITAPGDTPIERVRGLVDLCRKCGLRRFTFKTSEIDRDRSK
jgi:biopolymer transport protein ExbD